MSKWLLVELAEDLAGQHTTHAGVFASIHTVAGIVRVVDISVISRETLDRWLLPEQPQPVRKRNGRKAS